MAFAPSPLAPILPSYSGKGILWGQLHGASLPMAIASSINTHNGPVVVICADQQTANRIEEEVAYFLPNHTSQNPSYSFPDWETLPYDTFSVHQAITSQRIKTLYHLPHCERGLLIVATNTLAHRLCPQAYIQQSTCIMQVGETLHIQSLRRVLQDCGYQCVSEVNAQGEFAVRGSIIDLFPMGSDIPYRIDLFDNEIDSIRSFDPDTQRSIKTTDRIQIMPAREYPTNEQGIAQFRQQWRIHFEGAAHDAPYYQDISKGIIPPGMEYYLPLFFPHTSTFFDYLPQNSLLISIGDCQESLHSFWQEVGDRYEQFRHDRLRPILAPQQLFLPPDQIFKKMNEFLRIQAHHDPVKQANNSYNYATREAVLLPIQSKAAQPFGKVQEYLADTDKRVLFCADSAGRREVLIDLLKQAQISVQTLSTWQDFYTSTSPFAITVMALEQGCVLDDPNIVLISENQLFGERVSSREKRRKHQITDPDAIIKNLTELQIGAPVVHIEHGVGRYRGLRTLTIEGNETEFLTVEYANNDRIYVPVASLHLISRYAGTQSDNAPLHRLGSGQWEKAKRKSAQKVRDIAAELLNIYARRQARKGHAFPAPDNQYHAFTSGFPFEETPDQLQAIDQVIQDMRSNKPMDRLVCGDVGFGKTEVALRAAFLTIAGNKQVAILTPTTLLAQQHYQTFSDRFANWPVSIELLSRFRSHKEQQVSIEKLKAGTLDIVIGTHKILSAQINFKNLGLVIIDEEHRFGVQQKEKLKALRSQVDILTLTATPIPRTLNMALSKMRDLSIIATPPQRRLAIKTFVREHHNGIVREAIHRELMRGGQAFYLHNDIKTIAQKADKLQELVPEARINMGHGQMRERELEQIMNDFYHQRFNVLVCTTIIENGIDIPSANTIIIDRADKFGLAQLHQLRGRVGRSYHQAYAYLFTPPPKVLTADAKKRLQAISELEDLGAGFSLATHDLEIRGAGELLGAQQSGNIHEIGISLFMDMLEKAVNALKAGKEPDLMTPTQPSADIDLSIPALIPETYLPDVHARLTLYKRIASASDMDAVSDLKAEIIDRFGLLPPVTDNLLALMRFKIRAQSLGIAAIKANTKGIRMVLLDSTSINTDVIIDLIQQYPQQYKLEGPQCLRVSQPLGDTSERVQALNALLDRLTSANQQASK